MDIFIYGLKDPETNEIRYIGKAKDPNARYLAHLQDKRTNPHKWNWISKLKIKGIKPELVILEITNDSGWEECEEKWIKNGFECGWPLTNICLGGNNNLRSNRGYVTSEILKPFVSEEQYARLLEMSDEEVFNIAIEAAKVSIDYLRGYWRGKTTSNNAYHAAERKIQDLLTCYGS